MKDITNLGIRLVVSVPIAMVICGYTGHLVGKVANRVFKEVLPFSFEKKDQN